MRPKALTRIVAILLALLLLPTSALAITYQELVNQVAAAAGTATITLDTDVIQDISAPGALILRNDKGAIITIDGGGNHLTGLWIGEGIFSFLNVTILGDDVAPGMLVESDGAGNVVDITLGSDVTVLAGLNWGGTWADDLKSSIELTALNGGTVHFQSDAVHLMDWQADAVHMSASGGGTVVLQATSTPVPLAIDPKVPLGENGLPAGVVLAPGTYVYAQDTDFLAHGDEGFALLWLMGTEVEAEEEAPEGGGTIANHVTRQVVNDIEGSPLYLYMIYSNGRSVEARLYDGDGSKVTFKQLLIDIGRGRGTMFRMRTTPSHDTLALGVTVDALRYLSKVGRSQYTVIRVQNGGEYRSPYVDYDVALLLALAEAAGLSADTELYLTGPDDDIMIRSADGTLTKL